MILSDLTPEGVRDEVCQLVAEHLAHYAVSLSPLDSPLGFVPPGAAQMASTTLAWEARALAHYALSGQDAETDDPSTAAAYARDRILSVTTALESSPWRPHGPEEVDVVSGPVSAKEGWPETSVGLACLAAWARSRLALGEGLTTRELAAVAGLSGPGSYRVLVQRGDAPRAVEGEVAHEDARRWLSGRGVPGL